MDNLKEPLFKRGEVVNFQSGDQDLAGVIDVVDYGGAWEFGGRCHSYDIMTFDFPRAPFGCDMKHVPEEDLRPIENQARALLEEERKALSAARKALYDVRSAASAGLLRRGTERELMKRVGESAGEEIEAVEAALGRIDDKL